MEIGAGRVKFGREIAYLLVRSLGSLVAIFILLILVGVLDILYCKREFISIF